MINDQMCNNYNGSTYIDTSGKVDILRLLYLFVKTYKNWIYVIPRIYLRKYHTKALLRNGAEIIITKHSQASLIAYSSVMKMKIDAKDDTVLLRYGYKDLRFKGAFFDGDILGIFVYEDYKNLHVSGCTVIDVGANIGDSAIYFAENGAIHILAIEPFPVTYNKLLENVRINGYENLITPINAVVSGSKGTLKVNDKLRSTGSSKAAEVNRGVPIKSLTLRDLLVDIKGDVVLKMDCEGCEYEVFEEADQEEITKFKEIILEFHNGRPESIIKRLRDFRVIIRGKDQGIIYAVNNSIEHKGLKNIKEEIKQT
jgi:FkbM family methyltransferase